MKSIFGVVVLFVGMALVLYMGVSMFAAVPEPINGTEEYDTYQSLTDIVNISYNGMWGALLLIVLLMIVMIVYSLKAGSR